MWLVLAICTVIYCASVIFLFSLFSFSFFFFFRFRPFARKNALKKIFFVGAAPCIGSVKKAGMGFQAARLRGHVVANGKSTHQVTLTSIEGSWHETSVNERCGGG